MQSLEEILYCPLQGDDTDDVEGWEKRTIAYVMSHEQSVKRFIRGIGKMYGKSGLQTQDVDDVYSSVLERLYNNKDYDVYIALESSKPGELLSFEGYVNGWIRNEIKRFIEEQYKWNSTYKGQSGVQTTDGESSKIFDDIVDKEVEVGVDSLEYSIEDVCRGIEPYRYKFGVDIYLLVYVRMLSNEEEFRTVLEALGIGKYDLDKFDYNLEDSMIVALLKSIANSDKSYAIDVLEHYVYGYKTIREIFSQKK